MKDFDAQLDPLFQRSLDNGFPDYRDAMDRDMRRGPGPEEE